jgi:DNA-binding MarR family transcriptional regulator
MLALIDAQPRCTAAALVRRASLDAVAVHRAVKRLIDAGLVIRSASASDGRAKLLRLSARGQRVHDDIVPVALALERRVLAALPAGQARALQAALVRLTAQRWTTVPEAADGPATDAPAARGQCSARASKAGQPG